MLRVNLVGKVFPIEKLAGKILQADVENFPALRSELGIADFIGHLRRCGQRCEIPSAQTGSHHPKG